MGRQALTSKESELPMIFRSDWGNLALQELWVQQHREYRVWRKKYKKKQSNQKKQTRKPKPRKKTRKTKKTAENAGFVFFGVFFDYCVFLFFSCFFCFFWWFFLSICFFGDSVFFNNYYFLLKSTFSVLHGVIMQESGKNWIEISEQERRCFGLRIFFWNWECLGLTNISKNML